MDKGVSLICSDLFLFRIRSMGTILDQKFKNRMLAVSFGQNVRCVVFPVYVHHICPRLNKPFANIVLASTNAVVKWGLTLVVLRVYFVTSLLE